jgi:hypothetical protein
MLSKRALALSTALAALVAGLVLTTVVLPAEYGIDPTGAGRALGLVQLAGATQVAGAPAYADAGPAHPDTRRDSVLIEIPAGGELEYKFRLAEGAVLEYSWSTDQGVVFAELHGEPAGAENAYQDFVVSTSQNMRGWLSAPFDGRHGWYWKNENAFPVTVTLLTSGVYEVIGKL